MACNSEDLKSINVLVQVLIGAKTTFSTYYRIYGRNLPAPVRQMICAHALYLGNNLAFDIVFNTFINKAEALSGVFDLLLSTAASVRISISKMYDRKIDPDVDYAHLAKIIVPLAESSSYPRLVERIVAYRIRDLYDAVVNRPIKCSLDSIVEYGETYEGLSCGVEECVTSGMIELTDEKMESDERSTIMQLVDMLNN